MAVGQDALGVDRQADRAPRAARRPRRPRRRRPRRRRRAAASGARRAASSSTARSTSAGIGERRARRAPAAAPTRPSGQVEHVDRDADVHGARPPRLEDLERAREGLGQLGRVAHLDRLGRDRRHERALVGQVVQRAVPAAVVGARGGARDHEQRDRVVVGAGDRRRGVRQAGARDQRAHAGLAGDARVAVGHERRALLVAGRDVADRRTPRGRGRSRACARPGCRTRCRRRTARAGGRSPRRSSAQRRRRRVRGRRLQVAWLRPWGSV